MFDVYKSVRSIISLSHRGPLFQSCASLSISLIVHFIGWNRYINYRGTLYLNRVFCTKIIMRLKFNNSDGVAAVLLFY